MADPKTGLLRFSLVIALAAFWIFVLKIARCGL